MQVAVIGAGFIGQLHRKAWEENGARVVAVVDPFLSEDKKQALYSEGYEVVDEIDQAYTRFPAIEAVSICTPPKFHAADLLAVLKRGSAVLIEKPVAASKSDYLTMLRQIDERQAKVMVGLTHRFYPEVRRAAEWMKEGRIGRPISLHDSMILSGGGLPSWYYDLCISGGGVFITNGVHLLDRMQFILDSKLGTAEHFDIVRDEGGFDRIAHVTGTLLSGVSFHIHLEWSGAKEHQETVIYGTKGRIVLQTWRHATLYTTDGDVICYEPYKDNHSFEDRTLRGLSLEVQSFMEGMKDQFQSGLTLHEHLTTMNTIWYGYGLGMEAK